MGASRVERKPPAGIYPAIMRKCGEPNLKERQELARPVCEPAPAVIEPQSQR